MTQKLIRGSEVQDFQRCRLKWKYAWVDKLTPNTPNDKLFFGTLFHKFVETWYATGRADAAARAMTDLYDQTDTQGMPQTDLDDLWDMACRVTTNYVNTYWNTDMFKVLAQELTFAIPLEDDVVYTGTIDLVYGVDGHHIDFMDHKTSVSIEKYVKGAIMDRQISRYWWALQQLLKGIGQIKVGDEWRPVMLTNFYQAIKGREIRQFVYNVILKSFPVPPKQLKPAKDKFSSMRPKLSQDKAQNTTYDLYVQEIEKLGLNPSDYAEFTAYLQANPKEFFKRVEVQRNQAEINNAIEEGFQVMLDMENPRIYRNITSDCSWDCPFKDVCIAGMDGSNVDLLLTTLFKRDEGR